MQHRQIERLRNDGLHDIGAKLGAINGGAERNAAGAQMGDIQEPELPSRLTTRLKERGENLCIVGYFLELREIQVVQQNMQANNFLYHVFRFPGK